jgi:hypothetical protein
MDVERLLADQRSAWDWAIAKHVAVLSINADRNGAYASRKFILAALTLLSATGLVAFGLIADGVYSAVVIATVGAYITGNVAQKAVLK